MFKFGVIAMFELPLRNQHRAFNSRVWRPIRIREQRVRWEIPEVFQTRALP
jgi:hypothetical protein